MKTPSYNITKKDSMILLENLQTGDIFTIESRTIIGANSDDSDLIDTAVLIDQGDRYCFIYRELIFFPKVEEIDHLYATRESIYAFSEKYAYVLFHTEFSYWYIEHKKLLTSSVINHIYNADFRSSINHNWNGIINTIGFKSLIDNTQQIVGVGSTFEPKNLYYTHFNGDKPYKIVLENNVASVYKNENNIYNLKYQDVIYGKNPYREGSGEVLLFKVDELQYIIIVGFEIKKFRAPEHIYFVFDNNYNSDVNYPYGISKNYIFDFTEDTYINKTEFRGEDGYGSGGIKYNPEIIT